MWLGPVHVIARYDDRENTTEVIPAQKLSYIIGTARGYDAKDVPLLQTMKQGNYAFYRPEIRNFSVSKRFPQFFL